MSTSARVRLSRTLLGVAAALMATASLLVVSPAASAHDALVDSSPAAGTTVETLPAALTLTFSGELTTGGNATAVEVSGPDGAAAHTGDPVVEGMTVTVPLAEEAPAGEYSVAWRVVSSDGHPISGEFVFGVTTSTVAETAEPSAAPSASTPPNETEVTPSPGETIPEGAVAEPMPGTPADGDSFARNLPWIIGLGVLAALGGMAVAVTLMLARTRGSAASDTTSGR